MNTAESLLSSWEINRARVKFTLAHHPQEERAPNWINAFRSDVHYSPRGYTAHFSLPLLHIPTSLKGRDLRREETAVGAWHEDAFWGDSLRMAHYAWIWTERGIRPGLLKIWVLRMTSGWVCSSKASGRAFLVCVRECGGSPLARRFRMRDAGWDEIPGQIWALNVRLPIRALETKSSASRTLKGNPRKVAQWLSSWNLLVNGAPVKLWTGWKVRDAFFSGPKPQNHHLQI